MYLLTKCECGAEIYAEGCCGNPKTYHYNCDCGEEHLMNLKDYYAKKLDQEDKDARISE